jgi:hypothetical protein
VAPWTTNLFEKDIQRLLVAVAVDDGVVVLMIPMTTYRSYQSIAKKMAMVTKSSMSDGKSRPRQKSTSCPATVPLATATTSPLSRLFGISHSAAGSSFFIDKQTVGALADVGV